MINQFGPRDPSVWTRNEQLLGRGFGGIPLDNVGVQYGLKALQNGGDQRRAVSQGESGNRRFECGYRLSG
ncbi:DUF6351 family protein [Alcanivorax sp.]|uniref:DUF6351 family protein n=1 Tax=Alcanivorax sp. TaxID=1872427 RepID=UPI003BA9A3B1